MAVDNSSSAQSKSATPVGDPGKIRNVVFVGSSGVGKTTVVEGLLVATGEIGRAGSVAEGTTVTDYEDIEHKTNRSVGLALAPLTFGGVKINVIDAPGYADYLGDLRAAIRGADAAVFVISAVDGISGATRLLWDELARERMPRAILITKLDNPRADYDEVVAACRESFGESVLPMMVPIYKSEAEIGKLLDILTGTVVDFTGGRRAVRPAEGDEVGKMERNREGFIEALITESGDEDLMEAYLEGEELDGEALKADLQKAMAAASFFPIMPMAAAGGIGAEELLYLIRDGFPSPVVAELPEVVDGAGKEVKVSCDPKGPLVAEVIKTTQDPYVGRISIVRVFSGTLRAESSVHVEGQGGGTPDSPGHSGNERVGTLTSPLGAKQRPVPYAVAGDLAAVARLVSAETGDTLSDPNKPLVAQPWTAPEAMLPVAIKAANSSDEDKLGTGLNRLVSEDPTLRVEHNPETGQTVLWTMGDAHVDVTFQRLADKFGVKVERIGYRVALRETFNQKVTAEGRHVKQSGGHGQYAKCQVEVEPLEPGAGFEFVDKVVGGAVPRQFIPSVEKGVKSQMAKGVLAGYPVVDIRVTLFDGKAHSVDSSDAAFQMAGSVALREAAKKASVINLLEPVVTMSILVDDEHVGAIMSDLSSRRGRLTGTESVAGGRTMVKAEVPQFEVTNYATDLRSMSRGTGSFTSEYLGHEPMPPHRVEAVIAEAAKARSGG
ncbi:MAG: elongation factor G-like protein EF-G2 [Bifidobacteriaceae bacterium]|jgi:elongation factor G|nr:elongation factor G-like protein EF-G2 [Bifidobacteriaceae bacterium]